MNTEFEKWFNNWLRKYQSPDGFVYLTQSEAKELGNWKLIAEQAFLAGKATAVLEKDD